MVFQSLLTKRNHKTVFLGSPEAEAEATAHSRTPLTEVYEDFHGLLDGLSGEKFIVIGRKGSGKSAFGEYIYLRSLSEPNLWCDFIRKSDCNLERVIQIGDERGETVDSVSFFLWIIYTNILKLYVSLPELVNSKDYALLKAFLDKNSGYIKINELQIKELISKHGFEVATEQFKRFLSVRLNKNIEMKSERAPYYKLLGHLEEVVIKLLGSKENIDNKNSFVLFFDDLDVDFNANNQGSVDSLVALLRACRHVNNDVFGKNSLSAKVIIPLRDDIESFISVKKADTSKLFASYSSRINWYQEEYAGNPLLENDLNLKKFVTKRITYAFSAAGIPCGVDPWASLVADGQYSKGSFKYVINQTLFRPRDLLLFFLPLDTGKYSFPLSYDDVRALSEKYSYELAREVKNELSTFYNDIEVETIFKGLGMLAKNHCSYEQALEILDRWCAGVKSDELLSYLFDRSLVGTVDDRGWYTFKCRQCSVSPTEIKLDKRQRIVVQYGISTYLRSRGYT